MIIKKKHNGYEIKEAAMELKRLYVETALIKETKDIIPGKNIFYKMEATQPCGSFKLRGMQYACKAAIEGGAKKLLASSGGNAGLAVAYAGCSWNIPTTIVLPDTTPENVVDEMKRYGAEVIIEGHAWDDANEYCLALCEKDPEYAYIPPFDHPDLWAGHSTMVDEIVNQCPVKPDAIILSVGGGGMMNGVIEGLERNGWEDVKVIAVETDGAASLNAALKAGGPVTIDDITSVAKSLGAKKVAEKAYENAVKYDVISHIVDDNSAMKACVRFADEHRTLVEPACGASLSVVYDNADVLNGYDNIVVIVCGGSKVDLALIDEWRRI